MTELRSLRRKIIWSFSYTWGFCLAKIRELKRALNAGINKQRVRVNKRQDLTHEYLSLTQNGILLTMELPINGYEKIIPYLAA